MTDEPSPTPTPSRHAHRAAAFAAKVHRERMAWRCIHCGRPSDGRMYCDSVCAEASLAAERAKRGTTTEDAATRTEPGPKQVAHRP